ncbi:alpha/beta fold hydrolase [Streptomyces xiaopingdaonensis]|uniref:alpha/beta fold hydrolase n=1 Tax=Streptomyces xiaopingdaonensis TaxID=1565415 RepID=UPI0002E28D52
MPAVSSPHAPVPVSRTRVRVASDEGPPFDVVYERRGAGEPLVLLHGVGHHWQAWEPVFAALAASHDVVALDLPGFGASPELPAGHGYDAASAARQLAAVCTALGLERPHVAGNSLGGLLALELARTGRARSVTALAPAGFWTEHERKYAFAVLRSMRAGAAALPESAVRTLARSTAGRASLTGTIYARPGWRSPEAVVAETAALRDATGFEPVLASGRRPDALFRSDIPDVPVTLAWGDRDRVLLPRQGVRAKRVIPGAGLVRLRGCGHVPMNDDPAAVARTVLDTTAAARAASA